MWTVVHGAVHGGGRVSLTSDLAPQDHPLATLLQIPFRKTFISMFNLCERSVRKSTIQLIILVGKYSVKIKLV